MQWISNELLDESIEQLLRHARAAADEADARRRRNVIDPFSSLLIASTLDIDELSSLADVQRAESAMRGMSNALGDFHQSILGGIDGWENHDAGYDLECEQRQIVAEVKNKHNTMNAANRRQVVTGLAEAVRQKRGSWVAYLVIVVPRKPVRYSRELDGYRGVWEIDGASFYHLATGEPNALHDLFDYLSNAVSPSTSITEHCRNIVATSLPPRL